MILRTREHWKKKKSSFEEKKHIHNFILNFSLFFAYSHGICYFFQFKFRPYIAVCSFLFAIFISVGIDWNEQIRNDYYARIHFFLFMFNVDCMCMWGTQIDNTIIQYYWCSFGINGKLLSMILYGLSGECIWFLHSQFVCIRKQSVVVLDFLLSTFSLLLELAADL